MSTMTTIDSKSEAAVQRALDTFVLEGGEGSVSLGAGMSAYLNTAGTWTVAWLSGGACRALDTADVVSIVTQYARTH